MSEESATHRPIPRYEDHLEREYVFAGEQAMRVLSVYVLVWGIGVSGLLIGLIQVVDKFPKSGPVLAVFPFAINAWYILVDLLLLELGSRTTYMAIVEEEIRMEAGRLSPCYLTRFLPLLYRYWRYRVLVLPIALPIAIAYALAAWYSVSYLQTLSPVLSLAAVTLYIACPVLSLLIACLNRAALAREETKLRRDLLERRESRESQARGEAR